VLGIPSWFWRLADESARRRAGRFREVEYHDVLLIDTLDATLPLAHACIADEAKRDNERDAMLGRVSQLGLSRG